MLAGTTGARAGSTFDEVLRGVWTTTTDPGPYQPRADGGGIDWSKVLLADRFYALVQLRVSTYGPEYAFKYQCHVRSCRERFDWEIDLNKLPFKRVPAESIANFRAGNRFPATIPSMGRPVFFRLQTGETEVQAAKLAKGRREETVTIALASRIIEIEGVHANDKLRFIDNLDMDDHVALIDQMDAADGGLETAIEIECPHCLTVLDAQLPFGKEFWLPLKKPGTSATTEATE